MSRALPEYSSMLFSKVSGGIHGAFFFVELYRSNASSSLPLFDLS